MGLYMSKMIVEKEMGGSCGGKYAAGGARFMITLKKWTAEKKHDYLGNEKCHILLVDAAVGT
jgi:hypothetical protein